MCAYIYDMPLYEYIKNKQYHLICVYIFIISRSGNKSINVIIVTYRKVMISRTRDFIILKKSRNKLSAKGSL